MIVKRIVANFSSPDIEKAKTFYVDVLGLDTVMDLGWISTFASPEMASPQISIANEGGSGERVPDLSIEVDDLDEALRRSKKGGFVIEYGPKTEDWGVRRFFVRDPVGRLINILTHE